MAAISITDLENAKQDVDHIADIANSEALEATDRLGRTKPTLEGLRQQFPDAVPAAEAAAISAQLAQAAEDATAADRAQTTLDAAAAEAAAAQALVAGDIYPDTTAGLAATPSGGYFCVPDSDTYGYLILYKDNAGVAVEVKRFPNPASISSRSVLGSNIAAPAYAMKDVDGRNSIMLDGAGDPVLSHNFFRAGLQQLGLNWARECVRNMDHHGITFPALDYWGMRITGQSNASGGNATGALSTTQPFSNLKLSGTSLVPLVEASFETCATAAASHASQARLNNLPPWATYPQQWVLANDGASGTVLSGIDQGSSVYNTGLTRVTSIKNAATSAGKSYAERAMVLLHGETDNINDMARATYSAGIIQFKNDWNTDVAAITGQTSRIPMFIVQMGASSSNDGTTGGHFNTMHAMLDAAETDSEMFVVCAGYVIPFISDGLHYSNYGQRMVGEYVGKALHRFFVEGRNPSIVRPLSATLLSARALEITFFVPVPPLYFNLERCWIAPNYGFRILTDLGVEVTITNVYISDYNKVVIETSADMATGYTYEYASQLPTNSTGGGPYRGGRGNLFDSDQTLSYYVGEDGARYTLPAMCAAFKKTLT